MKYAVKALILFPIILSTTACSNHMLYNMLQNHHRNECYSLPIGQAEDCLANYQMSYSEYLTARKSIP